MSNALAAFGTLLKVGDGATPTEGFTTVADGVYTMAGSKNELVFLAHRNTENNVRRVPLMDDAVRETTVRNPPGPDFMREFKSQVKRFGRR